MPCELVNQAHFASAWHFCEAQPANSSRQTGQTARHQKQAGGFRRYVYVEVRGAYHIRVQIGASARNLEKSRVEARRRCVGYVHVEQQARV
jgi:hypothetical protein